MPLDASGKPVFPDGAGARAVARGEEVSEAASRATVAEAAIARQAEIQAQAKAALARERAAGMRDGARNERERARAEQAAALAAARDEHEAEILRRDALSERKLAEQRVEIRGAAFWRAAFTLGVPLALFSAAAGAFAATYAAQAGLFSGLAATERVLETVPGGAPLTVRDPDFALPDVVHEPERAKREPAGAK
jgi:hypothetical protein